MAQEPVPTAAGVFLGLELGGSFDGIVLNRVLQWRHIASHRVPPVSSEALRFNTLLDSPFHALTYASVAVGLALLWRAAPTGHLHLSTGAFIVTLRLETVPRAHWIWSDLGILAWGAAMVAGGRVLWRRR